MRTKLIKSIALMLTLTIALSFVALPAFADNSDSVFAPGNYSLRLQGNGAIASTRFTPHQSINFPLGTFEFSVWARGDATTFNIRAEGGGGNLVFVPNRTVAYEEWTQITGTATSTGGNWRTFVITASTAAGNDLFLDNFSLIGPGGTNLLLNPGFETGTFANWFVTDAWAANWLGAPGNSGNNWSIYEHTAVIVDTYTVLRADASTVPAENMTITPDGAQPVGTQMTVTVTPPWGYVLAAGSLAVEGVPGITLTETGATFPMPVGGGEVTVNALFEEDEIEEPIVGDPVSLSEFSGRLGEWSEVSYASVEADGLIFRATTGGDVLYTIVEGANRDTRNVYYISIAGRDGGFTRHGRPNVHYLVANGWLYRATADQAATATPEWFANTVTRISRINMEYHNNWTGMRLRLDQLDNPNPAGIRISWQAFDTTARSLVPAHLPTGGTTLMPITAAFSRLREEGVYYPAEYFGIINNPLMGGGSSMSMSHATGVGQVLGYAYVSWRSLQPNRGEVDLNEARIYHWNDYPVLGSNRDQWGARAPLLADLMEAYANNGRYVQLRMIMDLPTGNRTASGISGLNWYAPTENYFPPGGFSQLNAAQRNSAVNLRNRTIADIPDWAVATMRRESNRPNEDCIRNVPFEPDRRNFVWCDTTEALIDDGLYDRMRDPNDAFALFWQGFRDQPFVEYDNIIYYHPEQGEPVRVTDGLFRCAIPNPTGGADLRVCPDGCIPYRRPAGVRANVDGNCSDGTGALQRAAGWDPNNNWGPEGMWYYSWPAISGAVGLAPRYDHHLLLDYHEQLVNMLAEEIARPGSSWNAVVQVQLGTLGHWGEWHNWPTANAGTFPNAAIAYPFVRHYIDAFACNENVQIGMRYANWIGARYGTGYFHDEAGQTSHFEQINAIAQQNLSVTDHAGGFGHSVHIGANITSISYNRNANMANVPAFTGIPGTPAAAFNNAVSDPTFWMHRWSGGEFGDTSAPQDNPTAPRSTVTCDIPRGDIVSGWGQPQFNSVMRAIYSYRWNHVSNLAPRGPIAGRARPTNATAQRVHKNHDAMFDNMGYRFVLEEVAVDGDLLRGETVDVNMVVTNAGVAPFHRSWPFEVSFINEEGQVVDTVIIDEVDISQWMPRHRAFNNARPAMTSYRYVTSHVTGEQVRVYYRSGVEQASQGSLLIPAFDGRNNVGFSLTIPANLPAGEHTLAIAILDPILRDNEPAIRFHNLPHRDDFRLVLEPFVVVTPPTIFAGTSPSQMNALLAEGNVNLTTPGSGGYGIAANNTLVIPEGRTLYVSTILNVRRGGTLRIEGTLVILEGGRMNNDGHPTSGGGTIEIAEDGRLINYGYVESISNSFIFNYGIITNNGTTGNLGRFEVRANTTFVGPGTVDGSRALNIHRDAIRTVPTP